MYFINEKAGTMSINGNHVNFEKGLPALYRAQGANPDRKIIIWRDVCKNIHVETTYSSSIVCAAYIHQGHQKGIV